MIKKDYIVDCIAGKHFAILWNDNVSFDSGHDTEEEAVAALNKFCKENNILLGDKLKIL